jgi:hypothetical protein
MNKAHCFKPGIITAIMLLTILTAFPAHANKQREAEQAKLDSACEAARQKMLAPMRAEYIDECVEKKQRSDRASCERFYADFGNQSGRRAPLFYDLPECVKAFEFNRE